MTVRDVVVVALAGCAIGHAGAAAAQVLPGTPSSGAAIDRAAFTYRRQIPPGRAGVASLRLDLAALAHSQLSDIRLVSAAGYQVPYLLEADPEPLRVRLPQLATSGDDGVGDRLTQLRGHHRSVYALTLPFERLPPCNLVLVTPAHVFERGVSVLARRDESPGRDLGRWDTRAWDTWRNTDPDHPAPPLVLPLPSMESIDVRLVVDEGDNQPLPLEAPVLEVRTWRLRFVRDSADGLWLVYGRRGLSAPRYDLALVKSGLEEETATEVTADAERPVPAGEARNRSPVVFWAVLVSAVVALLVLLARLLRQPQM
jgi:hypothetical protein